MSKDIEPVTTLDTYGLTDTNVADNPYSIAQNNYRKQRGLVEGAAEDFGAGLAGPNDFTGFVEPPKNANTFSNSILKELRELNSHSLIDKSFHNPHVTKAKQQVIYAKLNEEDYPQYLFTPTQYIPTVTPKLYQSLNFSTEKDNMNKILNMGTNFKPGTTRRERDAIRDNAKDILLPPQLDNYLPHTDVRGLAFKNRLSTTKLAQANSSFVNGVISPFKKEAYQNIVEAEKSKFY